jgi:hypothetical protein
MFDLLKTWAPILIPFLGLLAGTGWVQYYLNRRLNDQKDFRTIAEDFLLPLQGTLRTTKEIFDKLRGNRELNNLEYHPGRLQKFFADLPNEDPRKHLWRAHIEWLQSENLRSVELIRRFYGRILLPEFRKSCDDFVLHAKEWEIMWKALTDGGSIPAALDTSGSLYAPSFPTEFEAMLEKELYVVNKRVRRQF